MKRVLVLLAISTLLAFSAYGKQIEVNPAEGFSGIQAAVDAADPNDEIVLAPGVYTSESLVSIQITAKPLTLRSQDPNDTDIVAATILQCPSDGNESVPAIEIEGDVDQEEFIKVEGLTFTGGMTKVAMYSQDEAKVALKSCVVRDNQAGGLEFADAELVATDCLFVNNTTSESGGAINYFGENLLLVRSVFRNNQADDEGGAVFVGFGWSQFDHCQWIGNQAEDGGAIYADCWYGLACDNCLWVGNRASDSGGGLLVEHEGVTLTNCTMVGNMAEDNGGAVFLSVVSSAPAYIFLEHTIIAYNQDKDGVGRSVKAHRRGGNVEGLGVYSSYCCWQLDSSEDPNLFTDEEGTIIADPCFVRLPNDGGDGWGDDPATDSIDEGLNDDYGDLRLAWGSPCIDSGSPELTGQEVSNFDVNGLPRVMGTNIDMGCHEFLQPMVKVIHPQGGEVWAAGSVHMVSWTQFEADSPVDILLSEDGGVQWQTLVTAVDNTGSYPCQLPHDLDVPDAILRVTPLVPLEYQYIVDSAAFAVAPMTAGCPMDSPWSTLAGNAQRTGLSELIGPIDLQPAWEVNIPGEFFTSVTLGCDNRIHLASQEGLLYTLDHQGELLWSVDVNVPLLTTPTVGPLGRIYMGDQEGRCYAFDDQGVLLWTWETKDFICASVAVSDDGQIYLGSTDGTLVALSENGSQRWTFNLPSDNSLGDAVLASPAVGPDGMVYVSGYFDATVYALDPEDGSRRWTCVCADANQPYRSQRGQTYVAPVVSDANVIYQGLVSDSRLYAIDAQEGSVLWTLDVSASLSDTNEIRVSDSVWSEPALGPDGSIYVAMDDPYLRAVSSDGTLKWTVPLGQTGGFTLAAGPDGLIYAAGDDGTLYVVNTEGQIVSELTGSSSLCYPVVTADGLLLVTDVEHGLRVFGASL